MKKAIFFLFLSIIYYHAVAADSANFVASPVCFGDTTILVSTSTSSNTITTTKWDLNGDGIFNDASGITIKHLFNLAGAYNVGIRIYTNVGDSATAYKVVRVNSVPIADFSLTNPCLGDSVRFYNESTVQNDTIINYMWSFGDNLQTDIRENPTHYYNAAYIYPVSLVALTVKGCSDTVVHNVTINPNPVLNLIFSRDTTFFNDETLTITVSGTFDSVFWWRDHHSLTSYTNMHQVTVNTAGLYEVEVMDGRGCFDARTVHVTVNDRKIITPMTVFTPNNDGVNDYWVINNLGDHKDCVVTVYNRWGEEVYSSSAYNNDWGATFQGNSLPEGTYYYVIKCSDTETKKGAVNVIR